MPGLKQKLNDLIKEHGYFTLNQVYKAAEDLGYKQRTAERTLNPSLSPNIVTVKNEKGQITGYRWKGKELSEGAKKFLKDFPSDDKSRKEGTQPTDSRNTSSQGQTLFALR